MGENAILECIYDEENDLAIWNNIFSCNKKKCSVLKIPNSIIEEINENLEIGNTFKIVCKDQFKLVHSPSTIKCLYNENYHIAEWTNIPVCSIKKCPEILIENSNISNVSLEIGNEIEIICHSQYELKPSSKKLHKLKCGFDEITKEAIWEDLFVCEKMQCDLSDLRIENSVETVGIIESSDPIGSKHFIECDEQYDLVYENNDGKFYNPEIPIECKFDFFENKPFWNFCPELYIDNSENASEVLDFEIGSVFRVECDKIYRLSDEDNEIKCVFNSTLKEAVWNKKVTCVKKNCETINIENSVLEENLEHFVHGDIVPVSCKLGFEPDKDTNEMKCSFNEQSNRMEWSNVVYCVISF
ncbi:Sushi, von Willebrand factor type A, EGF and pentraxin [Bonamia ostreae]|uniref:Sushi, von Willebrand factor type A, EGF and pentraxin n=1 Tax=Bonamia ostreae TaxID=126728 RepID=A0ABV2AG55_9EUKA